MAQFVRNLTKYGINETKHIGGNLYNMHGVIIETGFRMLKLVWAVEHLVVQIKAEELSASCHNYIVVSIGYSKEHLKIHNLRNITC